MRWNEPANAWKTIVMVARRGCSGVGRALTMGSATTALAVMLSMGGVGCSESRTIGPDAGDPDTSLEDVSYIDNSFPDVGEPDIIGNYFLDEDGDGWGEGFGPGPDCNDDDPTIHPEAPEICGDGIDQDCDGEDVMCGDDADGDGYPAPDDCDDTDPDVYPGAPEDECCSRKDYNCDGEIGPDPDEPIACNCFYDDDGDGFGDGFGPGPDCDDTDATVFPGAPETCGDGVDQDCDGEDVMCGVDADMDGAPAGYDCDDENPRIRPGAPESCEADGIDSDCDGEDLAVWPRACDTDADGDGWGAMRDCNDEDPNVHPGVAEDICPDGTDQNCDGVDGDPEVICNGMLDVEDLMSLESSEDWA